MTVLGTNVNGLYTQERAVNVPARSAGPSVADPATTPFQFPLPSPAPATPAGPFSPLPVLPQPDTCKYSQRLHSRPDRSPKLLDVPVPTPSYAAGTLPYGAYEQPLAGPSSASQWPYTHPATSVDKGKARATDHTPPFRPASTGYDGE